MLQLNEIQLAMLAGGFACGTMVTYLLSRSAAKQRYAALEDSALQTAAELEQLRQQRDVQVAEKDTVIAEQHRELMSMQSQLGELRQQAQQLAQLQQDYRAQLDEYKQLQSAHAALQARHDAQAARMSEVQRGHDEKLALMEAAEQRLQTQFENLANKIFESKSENFSKQSQSGLESILTPLKEQIETFKRQISDQYVREGQERASLKTEILSLKELNQRITEEANALTMALKGDNKKQGNWGEVVLERILKESGLREGHEFETQVSLRAHDGKLQQPDVVVHLPNDKDVIIDAKVSLSAYERFFNTDDEELRRQHLKDHVASLRGHIKGLGAKDYQELDGLRTLDYVLMFIPVEPAFLLAVEEEPELVTLALNHNIMLVSPTNLLVALRTINNIWQYEYQNQNAQKIAQHAAKLYDKFSGFVTDMEKIGKSLDTTQKHYEGAFNKLSQGRGNIVRQIEQFRKLGVQPSKSLPVSVASQVEDEEVIE